MLCQEQARTAIAKIHKLPNFEELMRKHYREHHPNPDIVTGFIRSEAMKLCPPGASDRMIAREEAAEAAATAPDAVTTAHPLEAAAAATAATPAEKN